METIILNHVSDLNSLFKNFNIILIKSINDKKEVLKNLSSIQNNKLNIFIIYSKINDSYNSLDPLLNTLKNYKKIFILDGTTSIFISCYFKNKFPSISNLIKVSKLYPSNHLNILVTNTLTLLINSKLNSYDYLITEELENCIIYKSIQE